MITTTTKRKPRRSRKQSPTMVWLHSLSTRAKAVIGFLAGVGIVAGASSQIAWSKDVARIEQLIERNQRATDSAILRGQLSGEITFMDMRKRSIEDRVFELQGRKQLLGKRFSVQDQLLLERSTRELNEISGRLSQKEAMFEGMRVIK